MQSMMTGRRSVPARTGKRQSRQRNHDVIRRATFELLEERRLLSATITQTLTFTDTKTDWTQNASFNKFDPALGTLTSVTFTHSGTIRSDIQAENTSPTPATLTNNVTGTLTATGVGLNSSISFSGSIGSFSATAYDGLLDFGGTSGITTSNTTSDTQTSTLTAPVDDLSAYIGSGMATLSVQEQANASSSVTGGGNLVTSVDTFASANVTVIYTYEPPVTIGDFVWHDLNANGVQDAGEPGINGVTLTLTGTDFLNNPVTDHTTTSGSGGYLFKELPGTYTVTVDASNFSGVGALNGYTPTATGKGTTATDSNPSPSGTTPGTLPGGSSDLTVDFGFYKPVTIGDFVWNDVNGNGIQDSGEPGIPGVTLTLTGTTGSGQSITQTTTTDATGHYLFTEPPGTYTVAVTTPSGYTPTVTGQGTPATDSNPSPTGTTPGALPGGSSDLTLDFGFYQPVTIGDFVWNDLNANGVQDAGEPGIAGVTLTLTGTTGSGTSVTQTTTTDANGHYLFTEPPGTYTVAVTPPSGYVATVTGQGTPATDSNPSPTGTTPAALPGGSSDLTLDFGFYGTPGIEIIKVADTTAALPFEPVTYTYNVYNTGLVPLSNVVVTDDNGTPSYSGDDFNPAPVLGSATDAVPSDATHNLGDYNNDGKLDTTEVWTYTATIIPPVEECATVNGTQVDAGTLIVQKLASGDYQVTYLQNQGVNDNRYGTGATAATGWPNGHKFGDLTGSDEAEFKFTNGAGTVVLDFQVDYISAATSATFPSGTVSYPSGYGTLGVNGGDGKMITGSASNVLSASTSITSNLLTYPTGYLTNSPAETAPLSSVSTVAPQWNYTDSYTVVVSKNAFGTAGFGGVTIPQQHNSPSKLGTNLIVPTPCDSVYHNVASVTATDGHTTVSDSDDATVTIAAKLGSIGDFVWSDANANGLQDAGESGVPNVVVHLLDGNGNPVLDANAQPRTDQTDGSGNYLFDHLPAGQYQVKFDLPAGFSFTSQNTGSNDAVDSDANTTTGLTPVITLGAGVNDLTWDAGLKGPPVPGPNIVKDASVATAAPLQPVTYTYTVTNTGSVPLSDVVVRDDNGTPTYFGDDFSPVYVSGDLNNDHKLDTTETWTYTATVIPPVVMCATVNGKTVSAGTLIVQDLGASYKVTYLQNQGVNDNRYGTGATAATGWPNGHKFGDLTGSDEAEFRFTDSTGKVVLDFQEDYISASSAYPSGYGTLGVTGGDGKMITGSASNVLFATTSLTENLKLYPTGYLVNSPAETAPLSSISTVAPKWDYTDSYTVEVSKAAFGMAGFGGVTIPQQHNSPSKLGTNLIVPVPCPGNVINTAVVSAYNGTTTLTASDTATVQITAGSTSQSDIVAGTVTTSTKNVTIPLTNKGTTSATLKTITLAWPQSNGKLLKVLLAGKVVFDPGAAGIAWTSTGATITINKGTTGDRSIGAGKAKNLVFQFQNNVLTGPYTFDINFTNGTTVHVDKAATLLATGGDTSAMNHAGLGGVQAGTYGVAVEGLTGHLAAAENARILDAIDSLNASLAGLGVSLVEVTTDTSTASIHLQLGDSSVLGGVEQGVLGVTLPGGRITIIDGWNWYLGADTSSIAANQYDFETVIAHELGHALGLGHSVDDRSVMYPYLATGQARRTLTGSDLVVIGQNGESAPEALPASGFSAQGAKGHAAHLPVKTKKAAKHTAKRRPVFASRPISEPQAGGSTNLSTLFSDRPVFRIRSDDVSVWNA